MFKRMKKFRKNKKGLEMGITVGIIIIFLTLGVLAFFIIKSQLDKMPLREACHQAILQRGTISEAAESGEFSKLIESDAVNLIALKCKQNNLIITSGDKEIIKKQIADEMAACWSMLGKGKVNFFGRTLREQQQCLVCARITFDGDAKKVGEITGKELTEFINTQEISPGEGLTYSDFFAGAEKHIENYEIIRSEGNKKTEDSKDLGTGNEAVNIKGIIPSNPNGYAIIYTLWTKDRFLQTIAGGGVSAATATAATLAGCYIGAGIITLFFAPGGLAAVAACGLIGGVAGTAIGTITYSETSDFVDSITGTKYLATINLAEYTSQGLMTAGKDNKNFICTSFQDIPD